MKLSRVVWLCLLSLPSAGYAQPISFTDAWQQVLKVSDKLQAQSQEVNRAKGEEEAGESLNFLIRHSR